MLLEDVGADDFGVELPDGFEASEIGVGVVFVEVGSVVWGETYHAGFVEHTKKLGTGRGDETSVELDVGVSAELAENEDGFQGSPYEVGAGITPRPSWLLVTPNRSLHCPHLGTLGFGDGDGSEAGLFRTIALYCIEFVDDCSVHSLKALYTFIARRIESQANSLFSEGKRTSFHVNLPSKYARFPHTPSGHHPTGDA